MINRPLPRKNQPPPLLSVESLSVAYQSRKGALPVVRDVSFSLRAGEALGLVGESGCGKSTLAFAIMQHLGRTGKITGGCIRLGGRRLDSFGREELRRVRGAEMGMVYQEPLGSLNPVMRVGAQLAEVVRAHQRVSRREARQRALDSLEEVRLADPGATLERYPHQLSGGQLQRVLIAMALICRPSLLILDEPTTGLDATIEAAVLAMVADLRARRGMALLFISHNLAVLHRVCDRVGVMYAGEVVEQGPLEKVFRRPAHPYTRGLLDCLPRVEHGGQAGPLLPIPGRMAAPHELGVGCAFAPRCGHVQPACLAQPVAVETVTPQGAHAVRCLRHREVPPWRAGKAVATKRKPIRDGEVPVLAMEDLRKSYPGGGGWLPGWLGGKPVQALQGVTLTAGKGRTLAIVGESGCGKSTLARIVAGLEPADGGVVHFDGHDLGKMPAGQRPPELLRKLQMVFQHPEASLNPSHTIGFAVSRALRRLGGVRGAALPGMVKKLLGAVQLPPETAARLPRELSGGQIQRVAIARALAGQPRLIIADEPVSALDVSVQAAIINLLLDIQRKQGATLLFISHDLALVRHLADEVAVMYLGRVMEHGPVESVFAPPHHPYTAALLAAAPTLGEAGAPKILLEGAPPSPTDLPRGCPFHTRCPRKLGPECEEASPPLRLGPHGHQVACHIPLEELGG